MKMKATAPKYYKIEEINQKHNIQITELNYKYCKNEWRSKILCCKSQK